ncbi:hypothetical protein RND71_042361 [Anisodus tanguticus]|uniref:Uncharacterized protein n=1 Tax=Anisodus tanguticus TaxID=243964 RepID=A0AAE1QQ28_9SOLA|nr:hypothetical protein RND71_042361 [Anisodus tanguticus]
MNHSTWQQQNYSLAQVKGESKDEFHFGKEKKERENERNEVEQEGWRIYLELAVSESQVEQSELSTKYKRGALSHLVDCNERKELQATCLT